MALLPLDLAPKPEPGDPLQRVPGIRDGPTSNPGCVGPIWTRPAEDPSGIDIFGSTIEISGKEPRRVPFVESGGSDTFASKRQEWTRDKACFCITSTKTWLEKEGEKHCINGTWTAAIDGDSEDACASPKTA
eukprot:scaffold363_cov331-Pavlova_lutheri.AAC.99